ncbi:MAG: PorV/PorQ family protein [candidate division Zixibacteria bacterium]|nr:PorV/PorQ family protein [candidate division Zixibacteria bacterium]
MTRFFRNLALSSVLVITCCGQTLFAQDGLALMKVETAARPAGLGGAFVSLSGDPDGSMYNPALSVGISKFTASFGHNTYWEDIGLSSGHFSSPLNGKFFVHGGIRYASVGHLEARTSPTVAPDAAFSSYDASIKTGLSYAVTDKISAGFALGWFLEKIDIWRGTAFNVDFGIHARVNPSLAVGASATNLGSELTLTNAGQESSRPISLPTTYRLGGSYTYTRYLGSLDIVSVDDDIHPHLGVEAQLNEMFSLRGGYMGNYDSKNLSAGVSFTKRNLTIDYAFVPYSDNLGSAHLFNLSFEL